MTRAQKGFEAAAYRRCRAIEILREIKTGHDSLVMVVSFEDLVLNPQPNMERIAEFLGLQFEKRMLEGPQYNPYYRKSRFDEGKVNRWAKERTEFRLEARFPKALQSYEQLLAWSK